VGQKTSRFTGTRATTTGTFQETKTPRPGRVPATATSSRALATPKAAFSTGTQTAPRSATRTLSCRVKMPQATTDAQNSTARSGLAAKKVRRSETAGATNRNVVLTATATRELAPYA
jgi:hypothetical protein